MRLRSEISGTPEETLQQQAPVFTRCIILFFVVFERDHCCQLHSSCQSSRCSSYVSDAVKRFPWPHPHRTRCATHNITKQMEPGVMSGSVHTAHKQHQRICIRICVLASSVDCPQESVSLKYLVCVFLQDLARLEDAFLGTTKTDSVQTTRDVNVDSAAARTDAEIIVKEEQEADIPREPDSERYTLRACRISCQICFCKTNT